MNRRFKGLEDKQVAIKEHRKMWDWIANHLNPDIGMSILRLKRAYIKEYEKEHRIANDCYLCEFSACVCITLEKPFLMSEISSCIYCPVQWGTENPDYVCEDCMSCIVKDSGEESSGLYERATIASKKGDWGTARELAIKIRDLPEKELPEFETTY